MTVEAVAPRMPVRAMGAALRCVGFAILAISLWSAAELAFAAACRVRELEPCPADVSGGLRVHRFTNYAHWRGEPFFGVESGSFHAYGGPGGDYFRIGVGELVVELSRARCRAH